MKGNNLPKSDYWNVILNNGVPLAQHTCNYGNKGRMINHETQTLQSQCSTVINSIPIFIHIFNHPPFESYLDGKRKPPPKKKTIFFNHVFQFIIVFQISFLFFSYTFPSIQTYHFGKICVWHFDLKLTFLHRRLRYRQRLKIEESEKFQLGLELK